jgi:hypothetical protein
MVRTSERIPLELWAKESKDLRQLEAPRILGRKDLPMARRVKVVKMVKTIKTAKVAKMASHRLSLSPNLSLRANALID